MGEEETRAGTFAVVVVPFGICFPVYQLTELLKDRLEKLMKCERWLSTLTIAVSNQRTYCFLSSVF